jgi:integrase/recombinase XerD
MLEHYFKYPGVLRRMRLGPLGAEIDAMASDLERAGYTRLSARRYLSLTARFSRYAMPSGYVRMRTIDRALVERFLRQRSLAGTTASVARSALGHVVRHIGQPQGSVHQSVSARRDAALLARFDAYLRDIRGLEPKSREELLRAARRTIDWYRATKPHQALARLSAKDSLRLCVARHAHSRLAPNAVRGHVTLAELPALPALVCGMPSQPVALCATGADLAPG